MSIFFRPLCPFEFSMLTILWCVLFLWLLFFAGKYSDDDVVGGSCIACPTGYVSTTTSLCKAIDQKKYRPDPNVEKTKYCYAGHYCDGMNMLPCPPGNNTCTANATNTIPTTADPTTLSTFSTLSTLITTTTATTTTATTTVNASTSNDALLIHPLLLIHRQHSYIYCFY